MNNNEYLNALFKTYSQTFDKFNSVGRNLYSKDEYKIRHMLYKDIQKEISAYKSKVRLENFKRKVKEFFEKFKRKK